MSNNSFSSSDFLDDVKYQIKKLYGNQTKYAKVLGYSRKQLNSILNSGDDISVRMINVFCNDMGLEMKNYLPRG